MVIHPIEEYLAFKDYIYAPQAWFGYIYFNNYTQG